MTELAQCPFCGYGQSTYSGLRHVQRGSELYRGLTDFWIECPGCGATGPARRGDHTEERSAELAADRWNRRAATASPAEASDEVPRTPSNFECDGESAATESPSPAEKGAR